MIHEFCEAIFSVLGKNSQACFRTARIFNDERGKITPKDTCQASCQHTLGLILRQGRLAAAEWEIPVLAGGGNRRGNGNDSLPDSIYNGVAV